jgi:septum site-determining protein MinD
MGSGTAIAVHSYKGGTGKTLVSTNLSGILASQGKNVCLVDLDLRAPSLDAAFGTDKKAWVNDFFEDRSEPMNLLRDFSKEKGTKGRFFVILADPSVEAIRATITKDRGWQMRALQHLISLRDFLFEKMAVDYVIFDTSPGLLYESINAVAAADLALVIATWDASDVSGTRGMINELYDLFERRTVVLMNKIPAQLLASGEMKLRMTKQFKDTFKLPVMDLLPCYCEVLEQERATILALEKPDHPFSKALVEAVQQIEEVVGGFKPRPAQKAP